MFLFALQLIHVNWSNFFSFQVVKRTKIEKMFVLSEMKDTVKIPPRIFHISQYDAIVERLNKKFANKVK